MSDLAPKVHDTLAKMTELEQLAYSIGLSHAYEELFKAFEEAFANGHDIHTVFNRLHDSWDYVEAAQIVRGVL